MNLQVALHRAAVKFGYKDYIHAQKAAKKPLGFDWRTFDRLILGEDEDE